MPEVGLPADRCPLTGVPAIGRTGLKEPVLGRHCPAPPVYGGAGLAGRWWVG